MQFEGVKEVDPELSFIRYVRSLFFSRERLHDAPSAVRLRTLVRSC